jgi:Ni,Fe-hydrogenase III small subunit/NAD-dependent dihydropyrimidine dehydrogenase PreA subunit
MIFDLAARSLASARVLIPSEQLIGACAGSRMPAVNPKQLTAAIARRVVEACPTSALQLEQSGERLTLDYGECIGCGRCLEMGAEAFLPAETLLCCGVSRPALIRRWDIETRTELVAGESALATTGEEIGKLFGRALNIRQVDAGSCNGCEAEIVALSNPYYDLERFNIHFVASPKHADMLLVTGPVTQNMAEALRHTYESTPSPKLVVAVGACGCSGGIFAGGNAVTGAVDAIIPVNAYIPGCPPTPAMLLTGILQALRRAPGNAGCPPDVTHF